MKLLKQMFLEVFADVWKPIGPYVIPTLCWVALALFCMLVGMGVSWITGLHVEFGMLYHVSPLAHKLLNVFVVGILFIIVFIIIGLFALWVYCQTQDYYKKIKERAQNKIKSK